MAVCLLLLAVFKQNKVIMHNKEKKLAVLQQLSQEKQPIDLTTLIKKLGTAYSERSVRRWLTAMSTAGLITKTGQKRGTRYQVAATSPLSHTNFSLQNVAIIQQVRRPIYERNLITYDDAWFESYQPNSTFYIAADLRAKLLQAGQRSSNAEPAGTYAHQIFNRLLIDLSYNSSRLEGNTYSLLDTQKLLFEGISVDDKLNEEKIMILNHKEAIRYLVDNAPRLEVNQQTISTLHYLLADGLVETHYAGKVRDHGVRIGGSTYVPLENPQQLQAKLQRITKKAALISDPYEQSLFLLIHISYLQAFIDVNKRTARLSNNIPLIKNNLVPLSFNDIDRDDYNSAMLAVYELQEIGPILDLYVFSYLRTCVAYDVTVQSIGFDAIRVRYRQQRRMLIRDIILKKLTGIAMQKYIRMQTKKHVDKNAEAAFIEDTLQDLQEIDASRIAGLGVTVEQLNVWLALD